VRSSNLGKPSMYPSSRLGCRSGVAITGGTARPPEEVVSDGQGALPGLDIPHGIGARGPGSATGRGTLGLPPGGLDGGVRSVNLGGVAGRELGGGDGRGGVGSGRGGATVSLPAGIVTRPRTIALPGVRREGAGLAEGTRRAEGAALDGFLARLLGRADFWTWSFRWSSITDLSTSCACTGRACVVNIRAMVAPVAAIRRRPWLRAVRMGIVRITLVRV
jgi:hypothetical protein